MERVQFEQEQMLDELKDLVEKGIFTVQETKEIMKRRTAFETALIRRVAKKADYLRYAAYEMGLEQLRRKRMQRLTYVVRLNHILYLLAYCPPMLMHASICPSSISTLYHPHYESALPNATFTEIDPRPATVSSYSIVRRQFHIFERALKKFKNDVGLWVQYIQLAKQEGARSLVGRICARAIHLHPSTPSLYILAAEHELSTSQSPSAARALLQRGVRLNKDSVEMWREWVRMELSFVEGLRRRWEVLGIEKKRISAGGRRSGKGEDKTSQGVEDVDKDMGMSDMIDERLNDITHVRNTETGMEKEAEMERIAEEDGDAGAAARLEIMSGAIVKTVISSAAEALPKLSLFTALEEVIENHPSPEGLKKEVLGHMYMVVRERMGMDAGAVSMLAWRHLKGIRGANTLRSKGKQKADNMDGDAENVDQVKVSEDDEEDDADGTRPSEDETRLTHSIELVEGMRQANEEYLMSLRGVGVGQREGLYKAYAEFVEEWCGRDLDVYLDSPDIMVPFLACIATCSDLIREFHVC